MTKQQDGTRLVLNVDARAHCSPTQAGITGEHFSAVCETVDVVPVLQDGKQQRSSTLLLSAAWHNICMRCFCTPLAILCP
jgi:hypothetical protein